MELSQFEALLTTVSFLTLYILIFVLAIQEKDKAMNGEPDNAPLTVDRWHNKTCYCKGNFFMLNKNYSDPENSLSSMKSKVENSGVMAAAKKYGINNKKKTLWKWRRRYLILNLHYKSVDSYVLGLSQVYIHFYITNDYKQS